MIGLSKSELFSGYNDAEVEQLLQSIPTSFKTFRQGDIIALQDTLINSVYLLAEGKVKATMTNEMGKQVLIEELIAPVLLAPAFIFATVNRFPVNVICEDACMVFSVGREDFLQLIQKEKKLLGNFLRIISNRRVYQSNKIKSFALNGLKERLAAYLLQYNVDDEVLETQQEIAERMGVTRPSLARILPQLVDDGAIEIVRKRIRITDSLRLKNIAGSKKMT